MLTGMFLFLQIPKLLFREILQNSETFCSTVRHGVYSESFQKHFNIFSPQNVYQSIFLQENGSDELSVGSGAFGFTHLMDLSPAEVAFLGTGSFMERLMFSIMRWDRNFLDGLIDTLMETTDDDSECSFLESGKLRAVTRMLLMPSRSITTIFQKKLATGPGDTPFEALVVSHRDRLLSNIRLLRSTYTFIPRTRAPPVCFHLIIFFTAYFYFCGQADWPPNGRNNTCHYLREQFEKYSLPQKLVLCF